MITKKGIIIVFLIMVFVFILVAYCWASNVRITDTIGREVIVPQEINRIMAVGCSLREILAFDVADKIVGIEYREKVETDEKGAPQGSDLSYMLAFPELYDLPVVNVGVGGSGFNHEIIIQLNPDIIFMGASDAQRVNELEGKVRIPVVTLHTEPIGTPEQDKLFYNSLILTGKVLGKEARAEELINIMEHYAHDLNERTKDITDEQKLSAYIAGRAFFGSRGITATDPQWPPFNWVNVINVANELSEMSSGVNIDREALVGWNPDVIFISPVSLGIIENEINTSPFKELKAIQEEKVHYVLPFCWYAFNKENAIINAYYVGKIMYPKVFQDIDIDQKGVEVFKQFYGDSGENAYYAIKERFNAFIK